MLRAMQSLDHEDLPHHVKACYLYMMAFPLYQHIPTTKLFQLWIAEAFVVEHKQPKTTLEEVAEDCLWELYDRSLILIHGSSGTGLIKTCSIHSAIWPFYEREAVEHKVFQSLGSYVDRATPSHRRFSIQNNVLFSIKDVHESLTSVSTTRSLLCTAQYHTYPLRVALSFGLLRVLDALTIRFYEFPFQIPKLVLLRFLGLTLNQVDLPASMSNLSLLQSLIVHQHSSIKSSGAPCYLPVEIWDMKELRHLQVMGSDLPAPPSSDDTTLLPNLLTLSDVSALSCTKEVLSRTPKLKKLKIRIDLAWVEETVVAPLPLFDHLANLHHLESFKCVVTNPIFTTQQVAVMPYLVFPVSLKKLSLSGCGFSWEYMKEISQLPNLEVLKLRCHSFRGPEWEQREGGFGRLRFLLLEDLDLQHWDADEWSLPSLVRLAVHHCYKLSEVPLKLGEISTLQMIELVDCGLSALGVSRKLLEEQRECGNEKLQVLTSQSFFL